MEAKLIPRSVRSAEGQSKVSARSARSVQSQQGQSKVSYVSKGKQWSSKVSIDHNFTKVPQLTDGRTDMVMYRAAQGI